MERLFRSTLRATNREEQNIDLTSKLSPCGQTEKEKWITRSLSESSIIHGLKVKSTEENGKKEKDPFAPWLERSWSMPSEAVMMRCREMQTMTRVRTRMKLLLHRQKRGATASGVLQSPTHVVDNVKKLLVTPSGDSCGGESSSKMKTLPTVIKGHDPKESSQPPTFEEMPLAKRLKTKKNQSSCVKGDNNKNNDDDAMKILRQIPSVSTRGDGPNGKRIEGILYKYNREQVCIVCVCHGRFLSPSEFVMHAGGNQVDNPMKHITVSSNNLF